MDDNPIPRTPYRAEIDGLRTIAVVSVLLYHAKFLLAGKDWFKGGYVGVDIFFVISGYLITRIILSELHKSGSFSFLAFYERRARRILPMLLVVIIASMPFAWQRLLPSDLIEYAGSILSSLFFGSNLFFYFNATEYGTASSLLKPFLHTWSLGIEEQFYLVFPVIALLAYKRARRGMLAVFASLALASLLFAELMESQDPDLNFYLPFGRFWELSLGSVLALREMSRETAPGRWIRALPSVGLFLIVCSVVFFDNHTPHPSLHTLVPVLGTVLIIGFASSGDATGRLLGSRPFVWIGLISYSLYLWHYPIFAFSRIGVGEPGNIDKVAWIVVTVCLSVLSYHLVEKPFRRDRIVSRRGLATVCSSSACTLAALCVMALVTNGFEDRLPGPLKGVDSSVPIWKSRFMDGQACFGRAEDFCTNRAGGDATTVYAFGDSHLSAMSETLQRTLGGEFGYVEATMAGCPFVLGVERITNGMIDTCSSEYQNKRLHSVSEGPAILVLSNRMPLYLSRKFFDNEEGGRERPDSGWPRRFESLDGAGFGKKLTDTLRQLLDAGHHVVIVYPIPSVGVHVPAYLFARTRGMSPEDIERELADRPLTTSADVYHRRAAGSFELLDRIEHPNLHRVYPHELFCDTKIEGRCVTHDARGVFYFDDDHPSVRGSQMIANLILVKVRAAKRTIESLEE